MDKVNMHESFKFSWIHFIAFFVAVLAYDTAINLAYIKYISIGVLIFLAWFRTKGKLQRSRMIVVIPVFLILVVSCLFQDTTFSEKLTSILFYATLVSWIVYGDNVYRNTFEIFSATIGTYVGMIYVIITSWGLTAQQLALTSESRQRMWWAFPHPNTLGSICAAIIIVMISLYFLQGKHQSRIQTLISSGIIISTGVILFLTDSRTAEITVLIFVVLLLMWKLRKISKNIRVIIYLFISLVLVYSVYVFVDKYALNDQAFQMRMSIFSRMIITPMTALFGNGMVDASSLNVTNINGGNYEIAWVTLFYKNGIVGILSYLVLVLFLILRSRLIIFYRRRWLIGAILLELFVGSFGEALIINLTNVSPMLVIPFLGALVFSNAGFEK